MPGVHGNLVQLRHDAVDAERLIPKLAGFYDLAGGLAGIALRAAESWRRAQERRECAPLPASATSLLRPASVHIRRSASR